MCLLLDMACHSDFSCCWNSEIEIRFADVKFCAKHNLAITTSADKTAILHRPNAEGTFSPASVLRDHSAEIVSASLQITGDYLVTTSQDKTWCFYDIPTATCLQQVNSSPPPPLTPYLEFCTSVFGLKCQAGHICHSQLGFAHQGDTCTPPRLAGSLKQLQLCLMHSDTSRAFGSQGRFAGLERSQEAGMESLRL